MNVIPIDRQAQAKSLQRSLAMCDDFLQRTRGNLILYPEGTRSSSGEMQAFQEGRRIVCCGAWSTCRARLYRWRSQDSGKGKKCAASGDGHSAALRRADQVRIDFGRSFARARGSKRRGRIARKYRIRGLSRKPLVGGFAGLPVKEEQPTISASVVAQEAQNTKSQGLNSW